MEIEVNTKGDTGDSSETKTFLEHSEHKEPKDDYTIIPTLAIEYEGVDKRNKDSISLSVSLTQVKSDPKKPERTGCGRYIGFLLALCSSLTFTLSIIIVKYLNGRIGPTSLGVYRFLGVMLSLPILLYYRFIKKAKIFETIWPLNIKHSANIKTAFVLLIRGFAGCTSILLQYYSVRYITVASAATITFSSPIFVGLAAWICLGEKCGVVPTLAALLTLSGVIVTAFVVPEDPLHVETFEKHLIGAALAFGSMVFAASVFIILRYLRRVHFSIVTTAFGIIGFIESATLCAVIGRFDVPDTSWEWCLVSGIGILTLISQTAMTCAMKFEDAGPIALVRTGDVVFSFIWQYIFLGDDPEVFTVIGAMIVCLGVGMIAFRKYVTTLPSDHKRRRTLAFLLK